MKKATSKKSPTPTKVAPAKPVAKKAAPAKPVAKKAAPAKPVAKKAAPAKPVAKKAAPAKPVAKKAAPAKPVVASPEAKPAPVVAAVEPTVKPRGRSKAPLNPEDIPPPVPLLHQAGIEVPKAMVQPNSRPKEKNRVQDDDSMWTGAELKAMRVRFDRDLNDRRTHLAVSKADLEQLISFTDDGAGSETADTGNTTLEREMLISLVENAQSNIEQTLQALGRLDTKTYGLCDNCGKSIGKLRLQEANAYAVLCIACKEAEDKLN
jgi:RNA polymerase-binding transcription factor DksA